MKNYLVKTFLMKTFCENILIYENVHISDDPIIFEQ